MHIDHVLTGLEKYLDAELFPGMNENQQTIYLLAVGALKENAADLLTGNTILRSMLSISKDGEVEVDRLHRLLQIAVRKQGKLVIAVPMFGTITLSENDVEQIIATVKGVSH